MSKPKLSAEATTLLREYKLRMKQMERNHACDIAELKGQLDEMRADLQEARQSSEFVPARSDGSAVWITANCGHVHNAGGWSLTPKRPLSHCLRCGPDFDGRPDTTAPIGYWRLLYTHRTEKLKGNVKNRGPVATAKPKENLL